MSGTRYGLIFLMLTGMAILPASRPQEAGAIPDHTTCDFCHGVHGAIGTGFGGYLLDAATAEAVCLSCHGPGGISTLKADVHINDTNSKYPAFRITCIQCHDSHMYWTNWLLGTNIKTIGVDLPDARIVTPNSGTRRVVFESRGTNVGQPSLHSFADANEDGLNDPDGNAYDGACEVCHTLAKYHRNDASGNHSHNTGKTCTRCHGHATNFNR